jgi:hypothetical protein
MIEVRIRKNEWDTFWKATPNACWGTVMRRYGHEHNVDVINGTFNGEFKCAILETYPIDDEECYAWGRFRRPYRKLSF